MENGKASCRAILLPVQAGIVTGKSENCWIFRFVALLDVISAISLSRHGSYNLEKVLNILFQIFCFKSYFRYRRCCIK